MATKLHRLHAGLPGVPPHRGSAPPEEADAGFLTQTGLFLGLLAQDYTFT